MRGSDEKRIYPPAVFHVRSILNEEKEFHIAVTRHTLERRLLATIQIALDGFRRIAEVGKDHPKRGHTYTHTERGIAEMEELANTFEDIIQELLK